MANILDIFRTNSGKKLLEISSKKTGLPENELKLFFLNSLPTHLTIFYKRLEILKDKNENTGSFIEHLEKDSLSKSGKSIFKDLKEEDKENLNRLSKISGLEENQTLTLLYISLGGVFQIVSEIKWNEKKAEIIEILDSLSGFSTKFDSVFINTLIKNKEEPGLISSSEKIALDSKKDKNDQSLLGGYTGGK